MRAVAKKTAMLMRARTYAEDFIEYAIRDEETGAVMRNADFHREWQRHWRENLIAGLIAPVEHGKALALDTEIPTARGWIPLSEVRVGSALFSQSGKGSRVIGMSPIRLRQTYRIEFSDGSEILADDEHQWTAWTQNDLDQKHPPRVVTTKEIRESVKPSGRYRWKIPIAGPVQYPEQKGLPVHPYVLGAWLGDGDSQGPKLTCHEDDREVVDRCISLENGVHGKWRREGEGGKVLRVSVGVSIYTRRSATSLSRRLKGLGVVNNKHIPDAYLIGSEEQRRELLAGLLDTDGSVSRCRGNSSQVEFGATNERLAIQVLELVRSLGFRAKVLSGPSASGKTRYRVMFTARTPVFRLQRKLDGQILDGDRRWTRHKTIVKVSEGPVVQVRCLSVDSDDHTFLAGRAYTVTHNTQQMLGKILHLLGENPARRIALISNTVEQAQDLLRQTRVNIEDNERVKEVFPHLRPSSRPGDAWGQNQLTVERSTIAKNPSLRAYGVFGGKITGARIDVILLDDVLDFENTRTEEQRKKMLEWFDSSVFTRATKNACIYSIGTPWHPEDFLHELEKRPGFACKRYSAVKNPNADPADWRPIWPVQWPAQRLRDKRDNMIETTFVRKYLCQARMDATSRFKGEWMETMNRLGKGMTFWDEAPLAQGGVRELQCFTGVDFGIGQGEEHALTVMFTIALRDDSRRLVVNIESGRWQAPEIVHRIKSTYRRYNSTIFVESNGAQKWISQFMEDDGFPVETFTTGSKNKWSEEFGVESVAVEMRSRMWVMPSGTAGDNVHPEGEAWQRECLNFNPTEHTGDRLMASWFAREALRKHSQPMTQRMDTLSR